MFKSRLFGKSFGTLAAVLFLAAGLLLPFLETGKEESFLTYFNKALTPKEIKIVAAGDIMLDRGVEYMVKKYGGGDYCWPFLKIADYFKKADISFANLESPISDKGRRLGSIYSFRAKLKAITGLVCAGLDVVSLANNHALDYGREALLQTMDLLKQKGIAYSGAGKNSREAFSVSVRRVKGTKIGFLAYTNLGSCLWRATPDTAGLAWIDRRVFKNIIDYIKKIKQNRVADILVVSLHAGKEYSPEPTSFQVDFAHSCIDAGADLIIGHHPHVVQKVEKYKGGWIAYSLGNFIFDQSFSEETMKGLVLEAIIENRKIKKVFLRPIKLNKYFQAAFTDSFLP